MGNDKKKIELNDAKKWYEGFKKAMQFEGIDLNNPYALGRVNITNPLPTVPEDEDPLQDKFRFIEEVNHAYSFAFMPVNKKGQYQAPRTGDTDAATWLHDKMQNPNELPDNEILRLYTAAVEKRLVIQDLSVRSEGMKSPKMVYVGEDGTCKLTGTLPADNIDMAVPVLKEAGFTSDEIDGIIAWRSDISTMSALKGGMIVNDISDAARDGDAYSTEQLEKDIPTLVDSGVYPMLIRIGSAHPDWMSAPEQRMLNSDAATVQAIPEILRTERQQQMDLEHPNSSLIEMAFEASLIKKFNPQKDPHGRRIVEMSFEQIINSGRVTGDGNQPLKGSTTFEKTEELVKTFRSHKAIYVDGKPYISTMEGMEPAVRAETYHKLIKTFNQQINSLLPREQDGRLQLKDTMAALLELEKRTNPMHTIKGRFPSDPEKTEYIQDVGTGGMNALMSSVKKQITGLIAQSEKLGTLTEKETELLKAVSCFSKISDLVERGVYAPTNADLKVKAPAPEKNEKTAELDNAVTFRPADENARKTMGTMVYADAPKLGAAIINSPIDPSLPGDCARICKFDSASGKMIYPFYDPKSAGVFHADPSKHYDFLTAKDVNALLNSGAYYYFEAGSNRPKRLENGSLKDVTSAELEDDGLRIAMEDEVQQRTLSDEAKNQEIRIHKNQQFQNNLARANQVFEQLLGSAPGGTGTETYRDFCEIINDAMQKDGVDYSFPQTKGMSEADVIALTTLNFGNPDVKHMEHDGCSTEANTLDSFEMWPGDFFIRREGKTGAMLENLKEARKATQSLLNEANGGKNLDALLGETLKKSLYWAASSAHGQVGLTDRVFGALIASHHVKQFMDRHPGAVQAARESLKDSPEELKRFQSAYQDIQAQENMFRLAVAANAPELKPSVQEKYQSVRELLGYEFERSEKKLNEIAPKQRREAEQRMNEEMANLAATNPGEIPAFLERESRNRGVISKSCPETALKTLFQDARTAPLLADVIEQMGLNVVPANGITDRKQKEQLDAQRKNDMELVFESLAQMGVVEPIPELNTSNHLTAAEKEQAADRYYDSIRLIEPSKSVDKGLRAVKERNALKKMSASFLEEQGLEFSEMLQLATAGGVSPGEYVSKMFEQNQQAEWSLYDTGEKINSLAANLNFRQFAPDSKAIGNITDKLLELGQSATAKEHGKMLDKMIEKVTALSKVSPDVLITGAQAKALGELHQKLAGKPVSEAEPVRARAQSVKNQPRSFGTTMK